MNQDVSPARPRRGHPTARALGATSSTSSSRRWTAWTGSTTGGSSDCSVTSPRLVRTGVLSAAAKPSHGGWTQLTESPTNPGSFSAQVASRCFDRPLERVRRFRKVARTELPPGLAHVLLIREDMFLRSLAFKSVTVLLAAVLAGCWSTSFIQTDPSYRATSGAWPEVYLDRLPDRPYRSVGIIEVKGPAGDFDLEDVLRHAQEKGRELGCDLIVERAIHRVSSREQQSPRIAQLGGGFRPPASSAPPPSPVVVPATGPGRREFICGKFI